MLLKKWRVALVILWMCVIFLMSHLDGAKSWILTGELLTVVKTGSLDHDRTLDEKLLSYEENTTWNAMVFLRKFAHFAEYFILAILLMNAFLFHIDWYAALKWSLVISVTYAVLDEAHQLLIPDRTGRIVDVFIDTAGIVTALLFLWIIKCIRKAKNNEN